MNIGSGPRHSNLNFAHLLTFIADLPNQFCETYQFAEDGFSLVCELLCKHSNYTLKSDLDEIIMHSKMAD